MSTKSFFAVISVILIIVLGYFYFERFITEEEIEIRVINSEKYGNVEHKYFIFTPDEVFLNTDNDWQNKSNADELYKVLKRGGTYKVVVVGQYIPYISEFRNIVDIVDPGKINSTTRF